MDKKMYCYQCDKKVIANKEKQQNQYTVHNQKITINEVCYYCPSCHEELIDEELDNSLINIYNEYLKQYNLSINKFKKIRKSFNLSQDLFAKALGWSKKTITRYETGQTIPQNEYLMVYQKLHQNPDAIINILNHNKDKLSSVYYQIINKINTKLNIKTIHVFLYLLEDNPLYQTQIMKHLFAVDFLSQKERKVPITNFQYAHAPYGPIIDNKDNIINELLQNNYLKLIYINDDRLKFINTISYDPLLFDDQELLILKEVKSKLKGKTSNELSEWSHTFKGWQQTQDGELISLKKYAKEFNL